MAKQSGTSSACAVNYHVLHEPTPTLLEAFVGPLTGTVCLVEAFNEDGMNASGTYENTLRGLGATVSTQLGEHITHYIVSFPAAQVINRSNKRILAAEIMGITVVSPLWVEQCREAYRLAPTVDFAIKGSLFAATSARKRPLSVSKSSTDDLVNTSPRMVEHVPNLGRSIDSPFFNSSQRIANDTNCETSNTSNIAQPVASTTRMLSSSSSLVDLGAERALSRNAAGSNNSLNRVNTPAPAAPTPVPASAFATNTTTSTTAAETVNEVVIPLPTFREYIAPVVPATVLEKVQKRRRSERISDLLEDSDDELNDLANETVEAKRARLEYESWECVRNIPIDVSIPIVFLPGQEGDKLPPFVLTKSNASTTAKGGSGINGLNTKGKKVPAGGSSKSHQSAHAKNGKSGCATNGSAGGSGGAGGSSKSNGKSEKSAWKFDSKGRFAKAEVRQSEPTPSEIAVESAQPKSKVVIALTGFDDKAGDRSTLLQMLRQLIKTIRKRSADGAVSQTSSAATAVMSAVLSPVASGSTGATSSAQASVADVEADAAAGARATHVADAVDAAFMAACVAAHSANVSSGNVSTVVDLTDEPSNIVDAGHPAGETDVAALEATESADAIVSKGLTRAAEAAAETTEQTVEVVEVPPTPSQEKRGRGRPRNGSLSSAASSTIKNNKKKKPMGRSHKKKVAPVVPAATSVISATSAASLEGASPVKRGRGRPRLNSNSSNDATTFPEAWYIESLECAVTILSDPNDFSAASCTHVIVNTKSTTRTLRTLFALARGLCILTEEWVYQSVSQEAWAETSQFLHPRYNLYSEERGFRRAIDVFRGKKILVLDSISPPTEVLVDLVVAAGGKTTAMVDEDGISFVVFGDVSAANEWVSNKLKKKKSSTHKEVSDMRIFAEQRKIVTAKYLFNCIEETKMRPAQATDGEVISLEHLLVFNYTDRNIIEMTQQALSQGPAKGDFVVEPKTVVPLTPQAAAAEVQRTRSIQKAPPAYKEYAIPAGSVSTAVEASVAERSKPSTNAAKVIEAGVPEAKASKSKATAAAPQPSAAAPTKASVKPDAKVIIKAAVAPVEPPTGVRKSLRRAAMEDTDLTAVPDVADVKDSYAATMPSATASAVKAGGSKSKQAAAPVASPTTAVSSSTTVNVDGEDDGQYKISYRDQRALRRSTADALVASPPPVASKKVYPAKKPVTVAVPEPVQPPVERPVKEVIVVGETSDDANPAMDVTACDLDQTACTISNAKFDDTLDLGDTSMNIDSPPAWSGTQHSSAPASRLSSRHPSRRSSAAPSPSLKAPINLDKEADDDNYLETCNRTSNTQAAVSSLLELSTCKPATRSDVAEDWSLAAAVAVGAFEAADETLIASLVGSPARSPAPSPLPSLRTVAERAEAGEKAVAGQVEQSADMTTASTGADAPSNHVGELDTTGVDDDVCEWLETRHAPPTPLAQPPPPLQQAAAGLNTVAATTDIVPVATVATDQELDSSARPDGSVHIATQGIAELSVEHKSATSTATASTSSKTSATSAAAARAVSSTAAIIIGIATHVSNTVQPVATTAATTAKTEKKRKSEFIDPYADYDAAKVQVTQQHPPKVHRQVFHNADAVLLEDDIVDDSSTEGRTAASRGRVGGTAPFRQSFSSAAYAAVGAETTPAAASHARYSDTLTGSGGQARMRVPSPLSAAAASSIPLGNFATYSHATTAHNVPTKAASNASSIMSSAAAAPSKGLLTKKGIPVRPAGSNGNAGNNNGSDSESDLQFTPVTPTVRVNRE